MNEDIFYHVIPQDILEWTTVLHDIAEKLLTWQ
jgi:hypothetical protein